MNLKAIIPDYIHKSNQDVPEILAALYAGTLTGKADVVARYEHLLANTFNSQYAVATSSGSTAIQAALHCLGVRPGDEVLVPAVAVLPSVFPISANAARPVAVDVRPNSLDFDPRDLVRKITPRTKAALIVPLWGYPIDTEETKEILERYRIPLIEDAAHAHGAMLGHRYVGTFGTIGCFSTHDRKLVSTGEGGYILTDSLELANSVRDFTRLGNLSGEVWGVNFRFNALAAALGIARLPDLHKLISVRRKNANIIIRALDGSKKIRELEHPSAGIPNYYNLVLDVNIEPNARRELDAELNKIGLQTDQARYGYDVFYRRNVYSVVEASCPNADQLLSRLIQLPVHPNLTESEMTSIAKILIGYR
jgi:dTDP-4-amino-4,6-dideoxygalactose transaminase